MQDAHTFCSELAITVPELAPALNSHIKYNDDLLPHVFFGDVTRFAIEHTGSERSRQTLQALLVALEEGLVSNNVDIENLISVSFVENLMGEQTAIKIILRLAGPNLRKMMENHLA